MASDADAWLPPPSWLHENRMQCIVTCMDLVQARGVRGQEALTAQPTRTLIMMSVQTQVVGVDRQPRMVVAEKPLENDGCGHTAMAALVAAEHNDQRCEP